MRATTSASDAAKEPHTLSRPKWPELIVEPPAAASKRDWGNVAHSERFLEQHDRLLEAARQLGDAYGHEEIQITQIVAEARVSKRTFYEHFPTKDALFLELLRRAGAEGVKAFVATAEEQIPRGPYETFLGLIGVWSDVFSGGPNALMSYRLAASLKEAGQKADSEISVGFSEIVDALVDVFALAARRLGSPLEDPVLRLAASQQVFGLFGMLAPAAVERSVDVKRSLAQIVCSGLGFVPSAL